jgi:ribose 5-phosphate isomerase B
MNVAIGADHAGFELKRWLAEELRKAGHQITDLGTRDTSPVDYPDIARAVGNAVAKGEVERGILVCGSGIGACVVANKIKGVRAGICHDTYSGHQGVEHDAMNVLCIGSRVVGEALALEIATVFLSARYTAEERFARRLRKLLDIEARQQ